ncbi:MAG: hypothetical protein HYV04_07375 [Deltaproteobacteria bacterium]|nr:hypothetical protein [Deltaproteobacteria bacterium]
MYAIGEEIEIVIFRFGEKVVHRFKDPDEKEWLAIARDFAALRSKSGDEEAQRALLIEYDRRVVSVGGYTLDGVDVMQARPPTGEILSRPSTRRK